LQHQQGGHLSQRFLFAPELALQLLVLALELAKGPAGLARSGHGGRAKVVAPLLQLVLKQAALPAPRRQGCIAQRVAFL